jgi:hypothetical protein
MAGIDSVNTATTGATQAQAALAGLPPPSLARAASNNTVNAELVSSQWGVDPASVSGVYGGAAESGGLFAGDSLLPLLTTLSRANAEQALALIGVQTPKPGANEPAASESTTTDAAAESSPQSQATLAQTASSSSAPMVVDPLWGRSA